MRSVFVGSSGATGTTTNYYHMLVGNFGGQANIAVRSNVMGSNGILSYFTVLLGTAPGAGTSRTYTVYQNGNPTSMAVTISNTETSGVYVGQLSYSAGDLMSIKSTVSGTPAGTTTKQSFVNDTPTPYTSLLFGGDATNPQVANNYFAVCAAQVGVSNIDLAKSVIPCAGTISNLYILQTAASGSGKSVTYTLYLNGSPTALTCTVSDAATTSNDTAHSVTVAPGDTVALKHEHTNSPAAAQSSAGLMFSAAQDGNFLFMSIANANQANNTDTNYQSLISASGWNTEAARINVMRYLIFKNMYVELGVAPGTDNTFTYQLRRSNGAGGNGSLSVAITGDATSGNDTAHTDTCTALETACVAAIPDGGPTLSTRTTIGITAQITPPIMTTNKGFI